MSMNHTEGDAMETARVETVDHLKSQQMIWPQWMQDACAGQTTVKVTRKVTPFGTFVVGIAPAEDDTLKAMLAEEHTAATTWIEDAR